MRVSSAMIMLAVQECLKTEYESVRAMVHDEPVNLVPRLEDRIQGLLEQAASLAIAHYGITRRNPSFEMAEVHSIVRSMSAGMKVLCEDETVAMMSRMHNAT